MDYKKVSGKTVAFSTFLLLTLIILSACGAGVSMTIEPNPIVFTEEDVGENKEITVSMRTTGMGSIEVSHLDILVLDEDSDEVYKDTVEVEESSFVVGGLGFEENFNFNLCDIAEEETGRELTEEECAVYYAAELAGKEYTLELILQGSFTSTAEADIIFE